MNEMRERFEETKFAKGGGSCFECCDFEGMYVDLLAFIEAEITRAAEAMRQRCEDVMPEAESKICTCERRVCHCGKFPTGKEADAWNAYRDAALKALRALTPISTNEDTR